MQTCRHCLTPESAPSDTGACAQCASQRAAEWAAEHPYASRKKTAPKKKEHA